VLSLIKILIHLNKLRGAPWLKLASGDCWILPFIIELSVEIEYLLWRSWLEGTDSKVAILPLALWKHQVRFPVRRKLGASIRNVAKSRPGAAGFWLCKWILHYVSSFFIFNLIVLLERNNHFSSIKFVTYCRAWNCIVFVSQ
jgi:hypothetical protein